MRRQTWLCLAAVCLLCFTQCCHGNLEGLEDDDDAGQAQAQKGAAEQRAQYFQGEQEAPVTEQSKLADVKQKLQQRIAHLRTLPVGEQGLRAFIGPWECAAIAALVLFIANAWWGARTNQEYARAWLQAFASPGTIFEKNFSLLGPGGKADKLLMREGHQCYKFYASGRRHVQGMLATLNLKPRQDLLGLAWNLVSPSEDLVTFEALMAPEHMPPIVLGVGTPKCARALQSNCPDISSFTRKINAARDVFPHWENNKLHILAEHSTIFSDIFSEPRVQQAFNFNGPHAKALKYFRWLHITSDCSDTSHKQVLKLTCALPSPGSMDSIAPLVALVPLLIDLVGTYKLSPDLKKKAEAHRQKKDEEEEEERKKRMSAAAARKQDKLQEEKARIARMPPAERQKYEEKMQKKMQEKAMKKRTVRS